MIIKVIKNDVDYKEALKEIESLMDLSPAPESVESEKLNLLTTLVKDYESKIFPDTLPDPIDAILFRMEQQNLKPVDLEKYLGSSGRVSEILSRKRPLTLSMMRALEKGLGIPAQVLLKEPDEIRDTDAVVWGQFPVKEMEKRGYFPEGSSIDLNLDGIMKNFFQSIGRPSHFFALLRKSNYIRSSRPMDKRSLMAWSSRVINLSQSIKYKTNYKKGSINSDVMGEIAKLSRENNGPILVQEFLAQYGVGFVIEPHFPKTYVDGATLVINKDHPVVGLTLRHDRIDNFWFTLMHELAHLSLHYDLAINSFYDDLDRSDSGNNREEEADNLAGEILVPENKWVNSPARLVPSPIAAQSLADELGVHVAIVAGRMRHEDDRFRYLNSLVGQGGVRKLFNNIKWRI